MKQRDQIYSKLLSYMLLKTKISIQVSVKWHKISAINGIEFYRETQIMKVFKTKLSLSINKNQIYTGSSMLKKNLQMKILKKRKSYKILKQVKKRATAMKMNLQKKNKKMKLQIKRNLKIRKQFLYLREIKSEGQEKESCFLRETLSSSPDSLITKIFQSDRKRQIKIVELINSESSCFN